MKIRLLRGQVVVRERYDVASKVLWTPDPNDRHTKTHTGEVLAMGPPIRGIDPGFVVGDVVQFHFEHNREAWTRPWPLDGEMAIWVPQSCVDAVWE